MKDTLGSWCTARGDKRPFIWEREKECVCVCFLGVVFSYGICIHGMFVIVAAATEDQNYCNRKVLCNNNTISLECPKRAAWNSRMNFQCHQVLLEFALCLIGHKYLKMEMVLLIIIFFISFCIRPAAVGMYHWLSDFQERRVSDTCFMFQCHHACASSPNVHAALHCVLRTTGRVW